ncbi:MAG: PAS domain S-box protein [Deltaproteobacteria bacterium]|nr:PAS domain S-box protein [Deltaproteobacteria bacterium]
MTTQQPPEDLASHASLLERDLSECRREVETLKQVDKRLSLIIQSSAIPALVIDKNHVITHCNKAYEKLRGIPADQMVGTSNQWMTFYKEPSRAMVDYIVDRVPAEEILKHFGKRCRKSALVEGGYEAELFFQSLGENGQWLFFTAAPLIDETGEIVGAIETFQDVSKRRLAEEALRNSERRFRTLLDFVPYPIGVFTMEGFPIYLNPGFTKVLGWTLDDLEGRKIPFVPEEAKRETVENLKRLYRDKILVRHESRRLTKEGRVLDVAIRAAVFSESGEEPSGVIAIFRDITQEKRIARINEAMLHISLALPRYPNLEDLLDYVNGEVKRLLNTEGCVTILLDEEKKEFFILGAAYDKSDMERKAKEARFPMDQLLAGRVLKTGEPMMVSDTSADRHIHEQRDKKLGFKTRNLALVPLGGREQARGVLCAINKKEGDFVQADIELLEMIAGTVALSIENARVSAELKKAYTEVTSLNRAKDKVINHLSHELRTPISILSGALAVLRRKMETLPEATWKPFVDMAQRNLDRMEAIQIQVEDIMEDRQFKPYAVLSLLLDQCSDELAVLLAQETGNGKGIERLRKKIDDLFGPKESTPVKLQLDRVLKDRLDALRPSFSHRQVEILTQIDPAPPIFIPQEVLQKVIDGLIKNAVENTPDEGRIEIAVQPKGEGALLLIHDYGVGIPEEAQKRIFEGFFHTQDTMAYSSKRPFDFNAGGKGADLLRMKIFSERYHFQIDMASARCKHLLKDTDVCPGRISQCPFCSGTQDCHQSAGTVFSLYFPPAPLAKS